MENIEENILPNENKVSMTEQTLENIILDPKIQVEYDTLVVSGGSSKVLLTIGSLQYCYDNFLLKNIKNYIGTSSGAILCYLLIIGYSPIDIIIYACTNQLLEKLAHMNVVAMLNGGGASSFSSIYEQLEKMSIEKLGYIPTFQDLKDRFGVDFTCITYNITENKTEFLSYENYPTLPCLIAIRMSSNLPLIFEKYRYGNSFYVDGGISCNFGINVGIKKGNNVLGIWINSNVNTSLETDANISGNIIEYIYKLMFISITQTTMDTINNVKDKCKIVFLHTNKISHFRFNINSAEKLDLFSDGYQQTKESFE